MALAGSEDCASPAQTLLTFDATLIVHESRPASQSRSYATPGAQRRDAGTSDNTALTEAARYSGGHECGVIVHAERPTSKIKMVSFLSSLATGTLLPHAGSPTRASEIESRNYPRAWMPQKLTARRSGSLPAWQGWQIDRRSDRLVLSESAVPVQTHLGLTGHRQHSTGVISCQLPRTIRECLSRDCTERHERWSSRLPTPLLARQPCRSVIPSCYRCLVDITA